MRENENQSEETNKKGRQATNPLLGPKRKSKTLRKLQGKGSQGSQHSLTSTNITQFLAQQLLNE